MQELLSRIAVVTGGASGIGFGMARAFAAEGMKLVLADIEAEPLEKAVAELTASGAEAIGEVCDVSKPDALGALRDRTLSQYGAVHVLCNNAGVGGSAAAPLWEAPADEWDWVVGVNVMGVLHGIRSFVPAIIEGGGTGHVVNTASMAGLVHGAGIYGITKHTVVAMSEALFGQLGMRQLDIGVSVLCPGWVNTNIMQSERNRPEAPRPDPGPEAAQYEAVRKMMEDFVKQGLDPLEVGKMVVDAIREKRFYVLTHPTWANMIEHRMRTILDGGDPNPVPPANTNWFGS